MNIQPPSIRNKAPWFGFTLLETMVACTLSTLVISALVAALSVIYRASGDCWQETWAWGESQGGVSRIVEEVRNSSGIQSIDDQGEWVNLNMVSSRVCRIAWTNFVAGDNDSGRLVYMSALGSTGNVQTIVAEGITKKEGGPFGDPIFQAMPSASPTSLRIHFVVRQPNTSSDLQVEVDTTVSFRNN